MIFKIFQDICFATYLFSKLLPLLVLPLGASLLILFISLKKQSRYSIQVVFVILWSFSIGLTSEILWRWVEYPWQRLNENQVSKADAIVVLSGGSLQKVSSDTNFFTSALPMPPLAPVIKIFLFLKLIIYYIFYRVKI